MLPAAIYHNIYDLLYLHCDVSYDEVLDVAFIWKHNGQLITDKLNDRFVSIQMQYCFNNNGVERIVSSLSKAWSLSKYLGRIRNLLNEAFF